MNIKRNIVRFATEDFSHKIFALLLGALIWFFISQQVKRETTVLTVPISLNYDQTEMWIEPEQLNIQVGLRGSQSTLDRLSPEDINIELSLPAFETGVSEYQLPIPKGAVQTPSGVQVEEVSPSSVSLRMDRKEEKRVPVEVRETGSPPPGYRVRGRTPDPARVRLFGPSQELRDIERVYTEPVSLDETVTQDFQEQGVSLALPPKVTVEPDRIDIKYEITRDTGLRSFTRLPVNILSDMETEFQVVSPVPDISLVLRGPRDKLTGIDSDEIKPFVDISKLESGKRLLPVKVWLARDHVSVEYLHPAEVEVELIKVSAEEEDSPDD